MSENKAIDKANLELALSENNKRLLEYTNLADSQIKRQLDKSNFILVNDYDPCKDIVLGGLTHYIDFLSYYLSTSEQSFDNIVNTQEQFTNNEVLIYKKKGSFSVSAGLHGKNSTIKDYPVTIEFLLKFNPSNTQGVYFENNNPRIICGYWNTYLSMRYGGGKTWAYDFSKLSTSVNLITVCYTSASDVNVYVNGIKLEEQSKTDTWSNSNFSGMYIGKRSANSTTGFAGDIYRARIYNRVLSEEEILSNYNADMEFLNSTVNCIKEYQIDILDYHNSSIGIEDTPVGHIISHMGIEAPNHYLVCDGAEYNIADYPYLAQHFIDNFGSVNHFGGDGITTFAVPDLRGEFLRGSGTAIRNTGSGGEIGEHQDATKHQYFYIGDASLCFYGPHSDGANAKDQDVAVNSNTKGKKISYTNYTATGASQYYTSRPTNTSVLYCIKYEPTYYTTVVQNINTDPELQEIISQLGLILDDINGEVV
jgi:microcystin-dependent protein